MILREDIRQKREEYNIEYANKQMTEEYDSEICKFVGGMRYASHTMLGTEETSKCIYDMLASDKPVMIGRFGGNELDATISGLTENYPIMNPYKWYRENQRYWGMYYGAGFFPRNANLIPKFAERMYEACSQLDLIGCWYNKYEDLLIEEACTKNIKICRLRALEPWFAQESWTRALEEKRVLVIHPFADTMKKQYSVREYLFNGKMILPNMKIMFLKAVQTGGGNRDKRFKDWFHAYDYLLDCIEEYSFDIAIIGCGSYGFPLAADIKKMGKKAIHLGGVTQLLFGIMGGRWDNDPNIMPFINEYWVRPSKQEQPVKYKIIEGGCYW